MKPLLATILLLQLSLVFGQDFSYPTIKNEGETITNFIPKGWTVRDSASGDLNNDNNKDYAVILQRKDSVTILKEEDDFTDTIITQPRILIILFRNNSSNKYQLVEQSNSFILNHDNPTMEDPYKSMKIEKGILQINFYLFYNMGSWLVTNTSYKFRYQHNAFVLIGAENYNFHRTTLDYENYSFNFLTNNWSVTKGNSNSDKGNDHSEEKQKCERYILELTELKTFKTFKQPYTWEVINGVYL
jgi:hypothetical protein